MQAIVKICILRIYYLKKNAVNNMCSYQSNLIRSRLALNKNKFFYPYLLVNFKIYLKLFQTLFVLQVLPY